ncbi:hypothetical protein EEB14_40090 [Rhodococcus sp. WS4]|nr:hypothetical protein EEB14_40090 [Rhodococcus sp. WS4]
MAQPFMGDVKPTICPPAFQPSIPSWPSTPVIDENTAKAALEFQNDVIGGDLSEDLLNDAFSTTAPSSTTAQQIRAIGWLVGCGLRSQIRDVHRPGCLHSWRADLPLRTRESDKPSAADTSSPGLVADA